MKKTPGDIIILHMCTKNYDYMKYGQTDGRTEVTSLMSTVKQPIVEEYNQGILDFTLPDSYVAIAANKTLHYMT